MSEAATASSGLYDISRVIQKHATGRLFEWMYPDEDTQRGLQMFYARDKYQKHLEFFAAGSMYRERAAICANRIGKTFGMGGYEVSAHLTGRYPKWWAGRKFNGPTKIWVAGKTNETTRDILQSTLLGDVEKRGNQKQLTGAGVIPPDAFGQMSWKMGVQNLIDTIRVRHISGGWSTLGFKAYEQGRGSFEGTARDVIWLDEECPMDVYNECVIRTATTNGLVMVTFTPLAGLSEVVLNFMPKGFRPDEAISGMAAE
jgi:phage terminase large subunit-like protein